MHQTFSMSNPGVKNCMPATPGGVLPLGSELLSREASKHPVHMEQAKMEAEGYGPLCVYLAFKNFLEDFTSMVFDGIPKMKTSRELAYRFAVARGAEAKALPTDHPVKVAQDRHSVLSLDKLVKLVDCRQGSGPVTLEDGVFEKHLASLDRFVELWKAYREMLVEYHLKPVWDYEPDSVHFEHTFYLRLVHLNRGLMAGA